MRRKERPLPWLRYLIEAMADRECGASQDGFIRHSFRDRVQIFLVGADARLSSQIKTTSAQTNGAGHHSSEGWLFVSHLTIIKPTQCNPEWAWFNNHAGFLLYSLTQFTPLNIGLRLNFRFRLRSGSAATWRYSIPINREPDRVPLPRVS